MQAILSHKTISVQAERWLASPELPAGLSPADYLVLIPALLEVDPVLTSALLEHLLKCSQTSVSVQDTYAFQAVQTVLLETLGASTHSERALKSNWPLLLSTHEHLAQVFDSKDRGVLEWPSPPVADFLNAIVLQSYHIQTTSTLVDLAIRQNQDYSSLALELDILIYEANHQLWQETAGLYRMNPGTTGTIAPNITAPYLPMWAKIPNQDQAEELLINLRSFAPPWTDTSSSAWVNSNSYLIYVGLLHYDMYHAAQELKNYLERHLVEAQENWLTACISVCFAASSPS